MALKWNKLRQVPGAGWECLLNGEVVGRGATIKGAVNDAEGAIRTVTTSTGTKAKRTTT